MDRTRFLLPLFFLSACAVADVRPGYQLRGGEQRGILAVGLTASDDMWDFSWYLRRPGSGLKPIKATAINFYTWQNPLTWANPRGRLAVLELPAGEYEFFDWGAADNVEPTSYFSIPFTLQPGRVTYLGRLHIELQRNEKRHLLKATDHFDEDLSAVESKIHGLTSEQVDRQAAVLYRCQEAECRKPEKHPLLIPILIPIP